MNKLHTPLELYILSIMNIPRSERYKEKNILLVGLIPGPTEPKQHVNHFLSPLVDDLKLYEGVIFNYSNPKWAC